MKFAIAPTAAVALAAASLRKSRVTVSIMTDRTTDTATAYSTAQPPVGRQAVQGPNPENLTQTYFLAAESNKLSNGVPDSVQLSFQIG